MRMCYAGVIESSFAEYLHGFTDQPASALEDLIDSTGYQRQPFLKRLLPRQVRFAFIVILLDMSPLTAALLCGKGPDYLCYLHNPSVCAPAARACLPAFINHPVQPCIHKISIISDSSAVWKATMTLQNPCVREQTLMQA